MKTFILFLLTVFSNFAQSVVGNECPDTLYTTVVLPHLSPQTRLRYRSTSTTLEMIMESRAVAWLAIGHSTDGTMVGTEAAIGVLPGTFTIYNFAQKYSLDTADPSGITLLGAEKQKLMNATFGANETVNGELGGSALSFIMNLTDGDLVIPASGTSRFIYAVGTDRYNLNSHVIRGSVELKLSPCVDFVEEEDAKTAELEKKARDFKNAQKAHGFAAAIALGVIIPLAVSASIFRERLNCVFRGEAAWLYVHVALNVLAYLLLTFSFVIAILARQSIKNRKKHFNQTHDKLGLAIFIFVSLQVVASFFRPQAPKGEKEGDSLDETIEADEFKDNKGYKIPGPKTSTRKFWEIGHRIIALTILGMLIYQLFSGIGVYKKYWNEVDTWYTCYYIWLALVILFTLLATFKIYKRKRS